MIWVEPAPGWATNIVVSAVELESLQILHNNVLEFLSVVWIIDVDVKSRFVVVVSAFSNRVILDSEILSNFIVPILFAILALLFISFFWLGSRQFFLNHDGLELSGYL